MIAGQFQTRPGVVIYSNPSLFLFFRFVLFCLFYLSVRFVPLNLSNLADMISEEHQAARLGVACVQPPLTSKKIGFSDFF